MAYCIYRSNKPCFHSTCDFLDAFGNSVLCPLFPASRARGRCLPRVVRVSPSPVFSKHRKGDSPRGVFL